MKECNECLITEDLVSNSFDKNGICEFCNSFKKHRKYFDNSDLHSRYILKKISREIRNKTKKDKFNCIIGISGGVDSSYVAYIAKKMSLRVLLVHFDNGWNSKVAVKNIYNLAKYSKFTFKNYVIDWDEFKSLQRSFIKAGVVDVEMLTDHAIAAILIETAKKEKIKFILSGDNFPTENGMPKDWTWLKNDKANITDINKKFENIEIKKFPMLGIYEYLYFLFFSKVKVINVLNRINYRKYNALKILEDKVNFQKYENKHEESIFTKFYQNIYLKQRFKIDKKIAHLSALIRNNEITKAKAKLIIKDSENKSENSDEKKFVCEKLDFTVNDIDKIINSPTRKHYNFKTSHKIVGIFFKIKNFFGIKIFK